jgi:capsular exopolysaccharide synthesis family protein
MENAQQNNGIAGQINSSFDFRKLLAAITNGWIWIALSLTVLCTSAFLYLRYATPVYEIRSTLLIDDKSDPAKSVLAKIDASSQQEVNIYNEIFQLRSQDLIARCVDSLQLNMQYFVKGHVKEYEIYEEAPIRIVFDTMGFLGSRRSLEVKQVSEGTFELKTDEKTSRVSFDTWVKMPFGRFKIVYRKGQFVSNEYLTSGMRIQMLPMTKAVDKILKRFKVVTTDGRTSMLDLVVEDNLPGRGVAFVNALLEFYRRSSLQKAVLSSDRTRVFINDRLGELVGRLQKTDESVADIRRSSGVSDPSQGGRIAEAQEDAQKEINNLIMQRRSVADLKQAVLSGNAIVGLPVEDAMLTGLTSQYNQAVLNVERFKDGPALSLDKAKAEADLASYRKRISDAADRVTTNLEYSLQRAHSADAQYSNRLNAMPSVDRSIKDVSRNYETQQGMYLMLYQRLMENEISANSLTDKSKVIVAPFSSEDPIKPIPGSIYLVSILLGLVIPVGAFALKELFNTQLGNESDISDITSIPILGSISRNESGNDIVVGELIRTGIAEQFRLIRANLDFLFSSSEQKRVIMITSSISGEGKSFISVNLGLTLAIASKRVVILEFDLRKPKISERLNLSREGGISGYLAGLVGLDRVIKPSGIHPDLYVANCGPIPPNPAELLLLPKTRQLIEDLQEMFDMVIIDTAPIGMVSDAFTLAPYSGVNLIITRQGHTSKGHVKMLEMTHKENKLPNAGIIFNGVAHEKRFGYGYGYGQGYGYGYGYGYGTGGGYYEEETNRKPKKSLRDVFKKS